MEKLPAAQILHPQGDIDHELHQRLQGHKLGREGCGLDSASPGVATSGCCVPFGAPWEEKGVLEQAQGPRRRGWRRCCARRSGDNGACSGEVRFPWGFVELDPIKAGSRTTTRSSNVLKKQTQVCPQERLTQGALLAAVVTCGAISSRERSRKLCRSPYFMNGRITMGLGTCWELSSMHTPAKHGWVAQPHGQRHRGPLRDPSAPWAGSPAQIPAGQR